MPTNAWISISSTTGIDWKLVYGGKKIKLKKKTKKLKKQEAFENIADRVFNYLEEVLQDGAHNEIGMKILNSNEKKKKKLVKKALIQTSNMNKTIKFIELKLIRGIYRAEENRKQIIKEFLEEMGKKLLEDNTIFEERKTLELNTLTKAKNLLKKLDFFKNGRVFNYI